MSCPAPKLPERFGPFQVTGVLGEGGGGIVYAARRDGRDVALKLPHPDQPLTERERERFLDEARMMARVEHPAVVEVLDAGLLDDGTPYMAMPRLEGRTIAERVAAEGRLPIEHAVALFEQLADAIAALHEVGLVHRDLKPENVFLIEGDSRAKLLDFGIAKDRSAPQVSTTTGVVRGTPATMAPERFLGASATEASDVYELAVVLYVMLVGSLPWDDDTDLDARVRPRSPIDAGVVMPVALSTELMCALSTRPHHRPPSAHDFAERIHEAAHAPPSPRAAAAALRTVTSEHLRPWVDNPTPLDAALPPSSKERRSRLRFRQLLAPALGGVAVGLLAYAGFAARAQSSTLVAQLAPAAPLIVPSAPVEERATPEPPPEQESVPRDAEPAPSATPPVRAARPPAPAPEPSASASAEPEAGIPGGVYATPPYSPN